ncbi:MAG: M24 family metallopeptidase [Bacillota bacterium]
MSALAERLIQATTGVALRRHRGGRRGQVRWRHRSCGRVGGQKVRFHGGPRLRRDTVSVEACTRTRPCRTSGLPGTGPVLRRGMVIAIEPMVNAGGHEVLTFRNLKVVTKDGSLSAHFEHTVAVTPERPQVPYSRSRQRLGGRLLV